MRELRSSLMRHLKADEHRAIVDFVAVLEKGFEKRVHTVTITAEKSNSADVFGVMVNFDQEFVKVK